MRLAILADLMASADAPRNASDPAAQLQRLQDENLELRQKIADLDAMAHEDQLLCIPNRRGLMRELGRLISRHVRYGEESALLFLDCDGLKAINDRHGHVAGDAALSHVARLLTQQLRASDVLARYGGDEFCVLLAHVDEGSARDTAARLAAAVEASGFTYEGQAVPLSVTIGVAPIGSDDDAQTILKRADQDMYGKKG